MNAPANQRRIVEAALLMHDLARADYVQFHRLCRRILSKSLAEISRSVPAFSALPATVSSDENQRAYDDQYERNQNHRFACNKVPHLVVEVNIRTSLA